MTTTDEYLKTLIEKREQLVERCSHYGGESFAPESIRVLLKLVRKDIASRRRELTRDAKDK